MRIERPDQRITRRRRHRSDRGQPKGRVGRPPIEAPNEDESKSIADAALKLFSEFGLQALQTRSLVKLPAIHPALIYYYFKDKDDSSSLVVRKSLTDAARRL